MGIGAVVPGVRSLEHAGLPVTDLEAALEFFVSCFAACVVFRLDRPGPGGTSGAERLGEPAGDQFSLAMLELGGARLELVEWWRAGERGRTGAAGPGGAHVALEVADVRVALDALRGVSGVTVLGEPVTFRQGPTPGLTNAFVRAPGGILLELVDWADV